MQGPLTRLLYIKKLTATDAFTTKQIKLPRAEARKFLGDLRGKQSVLLHIHDEDGRPWELLCTAASCQYSLSRIGRFCERHNLRPGDYIIFYYDVKGNLRVATRRSMPSQLCAHSPRTSRSAATQRAMAQQQHQQRQAAAVHSSAEEDRQADEPPAPARQAPRPSPPPAARAPCAREAASPPPNGKAPRRRAEGDHDGDCAAVPAKRHQPSRSQDPQAAASVSGSAIGPLRDMTNRIFGGAAVQAGKGGYCERSSKAQPASAKPSLATSPSGGRSLSAASTPVADKENAPHPISGKENPSNSTAVATAVAGRSSRSERALATAPPVPPPGAALRGVPATIVGPLSPSPMRPAGTAAHPLARRPTVQRHHRLSHMSRGEDVGVPLSASHQCANDTDELMCEERLDQSLPEHEGSPSTAAPSGSRQDVSPALSPPCRSTSSPAQQAGSTDGASTAVAGWTSSEHAAADKGVAGTPSEDHCGVSGEALDGLSPAQVFVLAEAVMHALDPASQHGSTKFHTRSSSEPCTSAPAAKKNAPVAATTSHELEQHEGGPTGCFPSREVSNARGARERPKRPLPPFDASDDTACAHHPLSEAAGEAAAASAAACRGRDDVRPTSSSCVFDQQQPHHEPHAGLQPAHMVEGRAEQGPTSKRRRHDGQGTDPSSAPLLAGSVLDRSPPAPAPPGALCGLSFPHGARTAVATTVGRLQAAAARLLPRLTGFLEAHAPHRQTEDHGTSDTHRERLVHDNEGAAQESGLDRCGQDAARHDAIQDMETGDGHVGCCSVGGKQDHRRSALTGIVAGTAQPAACGSSSERLDDAGCDVAGGAACMAQSAAFGTAAASRRPMLYKPLFAGELAAAVVAVPGGPLVREGIVPQGSGTAQVWAQDAKRNELFRCQVRQDGATALISGLTDFLKRSDARPGHVLCLGLPAPASNGNSGSVTARDARRISIRPRLTMSIVSADVVLQQARRQYSEVQSLGQH